MSTTLVPPPLPRSATRERVGLTNTKMRYGRVAQAFHWATALLFLAQYPIGIVAHELPLTPDWIDTKVWLFSAHKTIGVSVFALALVRIAWALANPHPRLLNAEKRLEAFAASTIHWVLYTAILLVPLTGMAIHWTTEGFAPLWLPFPEHVGLPVSDRAAGIAIITHKAVTITTLGAIALHVGGALKHHFVDRDQTLRRMLPWARPVIDRVPPPSMQPSTGRTLALGTGGLAAVALAAFGVGAVLTAPAEADLAAVDPVLAPAGQAETLAGAEPGAPRWTLVPDASTLAITVTQLGSPVAGAFGTFDADIRFDPDALDASSVDVEIDLASLTLGSVTDQAKGLLGVADAPVARFVAEEFETTGEGTYVARGTLSLAGADAPVELPFDLAIEGDTARMSGTVTLDRMDWSVGATDYPDEGSLGFGVETTIELEAVRAEAAPGS